MVNSILDLTDTPPLLLFNLVLLDLDLLGQGVLLLDPPLLLQQLIKKNSPLLEFSLVDGVGLFE